MQIQANMNEGMPSNNTGNAMSPQPYSSAQEMPMTGAVNPMVYPEIFYKLQPYIILVCDQMDTFGSLMPTQEMVEQMTDSIYDDVCRMYPDIAEYARSNEENTNTEPAVETARFGGGFGFPIVVGRRFRRRGLLKDLIDILLLSELTRRRRRYYY